MSTADITVTDVEMRHGGYDPDSGVLIRWAEANVNDVPVVFAESHTDHGGALWEMMGPHRRVYVSADNDGVVEIGHYDDRRPNAPPAYFQVQRPGDILNALLWVTQ